MRRAFSLLVLLLLLAACGQPLVPRRLAGLARTKVIVGRQAVQLLGDMHGGRFQPPNAVVVEYGRGRLVLYLAIFPSSNEATASVQNMARALEKSGEFSSPRPLREEPQRFLTVGPGGHHLFWRSGAKVYWVAGDPDSVFAASQELPPPAPGLWL